MDRTYLARLVLAIAVAGCSGPSPNLEPSAPAGPGPEDEVRAAFTGFLEAWFSEDLEGFMDHLAQDITDTGGGPTGTGEINRRKLEQDIREMFRAEDYTQFAIADVVNMDTFAIIGHADLRGFDADWIYDNTIESILKAMKPGDYVAIANTTSSTVKGVFFDSTIFFVFRKTGDRWLITGLD